MYLNSLSLSVFKHIWVDMTQIARPPEEKNHAAKNLGPLQNVKKIEKKICFKWHFINKIKIDQNLVELSM